MGKRIWHGFHGLRGLPLALLVFALDFGFNSVIREIRANLFFLCNPCQLFFLGCENTAFDLEAVSEIEQ